MVFAHGYRQVAGYLEKRKGNLRFREVDFS